MDSSHLSPLRNPTNTPLGFHNFSINLSSTFREKENHYLYPLLPSFHQKCVKINEKSSSNGRSWVYETFENIDLIIQHLEFKVWEHPNLKVSTLTLKIIFFKWHYFCCLDLRCQHYPYLQS